MENAYNRNRSATTWGTFGSIIRLNGFWPNSDFEVSDLNTGETNANTQ